MIQSLDDWSNDHRTLTSIKRGVSDANLSKTSPSAATRAAAFGWINFRTLIN
jgi:hypothetical protein